MLREFSVSPNYAEAFANNPASALFLEKAGFAFEGRLKNNVVKDGKLLDSLLYAKGKVQSSVVAQQAMAAALSRGVTVHRAHFTVDLVIALRVAED